MMGEIKAQVLKAIEESSQPFAVFDFDHTTINKDIFSCFLSESITELWLKDASLLGWKRELNEEYHEEVARHYSQAYAEEPIKGDSFAAKTLSGMTQEQVHMRVERVVRRYGIQLREETQEIMGFLQKEGVPLYIISASPHPIIQAAIHILQLDAKGHGVKLVKNKDEVFTQEIIPPVSAFDGKVKTIQTYIHEDIRPVLAMGDSQNDAAMLNYAKTPVCIPSNTQAEQLGKHFGWFLLR